MANYACVITDPVYICHLPNAKPLHSSFSNAIGSCSAFLNLRYVLQNAKPSRGIMHWIIRAGAATQRAIGQLQCRLTIEICFHHSCCMAIMSDIFKQADIYQPRSQTPISTSCAHKCHTQIARALLGVRNQTTRLYPMLSP